MLARKFQILADKSGFIIVRAHVGPNAETGRTTQDKVMRLNWLSTNEEVLLYELDEIEFRKMIQGKHTQTHPTNIENPTLPLQVDVVETVQVKGPHVPVIENTFVEKQEEQEELVEEVEENTTTNAPPTGKKKK